jgi:hypothetical protein
MKRKGLLIATIVFFLTVNTSYFWEARLGLFAFPTFIILIGYFLTLAALFLIQLFLAIKEKFIDKQRLVLIGPMTFVLTTSFLFPNGLINFSTLESDNLLIAQREGAANCMTTLKLKANNKFVETNVCFGVTETTGNYSLKNDTVFFENVSLGRHEDDFFKFAVIKKRETSSDKYWGDIIRYKDHSDTTGIALWITKNELAK